MRDTESCESSRKHPESRRGRKRRKRENKTEGGSTMVADKSRERSNTGRKETFEHFYIFYIMKWFAVIVMHHLIDHEFFFSQPHFLDVAVNDC